MNLADLNRIFEQKKIDVILVSDGYNMRYISGFSGATGYLYISPDKKIILTDSRYTEAANAERTSGFEVIEVNRLADYYIQIKSLMKEEKATRAGFEDLSMTYADYMFLKNKADISDMVPLGDALNNLRIIKTDEELKLLAQAEKIGDMAFSHILNYIKPGRTELDIAAELESYMKRNGATGLSFDTIVASGPNSSMPHAVPTDRKVSEGDFVTMDFGCVYKGYCSDMTRTISIGRADRLHKEIYSIVLKAQLAALDAVKAGKKGCEVDKVARDIITDRGYGPNFGHGLGHSVGLFIHEEPRFSMGEDRIINAGTIETVEPGIYIPGQFGVRIEDMIVVTENGHINLTSSPKELIEI